MSTFLGSFGTRVINAVRALAGYHPSDPRFLTMFGVGARAESGIDITPTSACTLPAYWACMRVIAEDCAKLPLKTYRGSDGNRVEARDHPAWHLLKAAPNEDMTAMGLREALVAHAFGWGNGYAEIQWDWANRPAAIHLLKPDRMHVERKAGRLSYRYHDDAGKTIDLDPADVLHVHGLGGDGVVGWSIARMMANTIGLGLAAGKLAGMHFANGAHPSFVLESEKVLSSKEMVDRLRSQWGERYGGLDNAGKPLILEDTMKAKALSLPLKDVQLLESRQFTVEEVCRFSRVPPHKVQHLLRSTNNNIEHQAIEYVIDTLLPWLIRIEQEINRKLFGPREGVYAEHDLHMLLRGDSAAQAKFFRDMWGIGVFSSNDILRLLNLPGIGPAGDQRFIPSNMTTIDRPAVPKSARSGTAAAEADPPPPPAEASEPPAANAPDLRKGVFADALGRVVRREHAALGRAARQPETFSHKAEEFWAGHLEHVLEAMTPSLALMRHPDPPAWAERWVAARRDHLSFAAAAAAGDADLPAILDRAWTDLNAKG